MIDGKCCACGKRFLYSTGGYRVLVYMCTVPGRVRKVIYNFLNYYRNKMSRCQECTPHTTPSASCQLEHSLTNNLTSSTIYFVPSSLRHFNAHALDTFTPGGKCDLLKTLGRKIFRLSIPPSFELTT